MFFSSFVCSCAEKYRVFQRTQITFCWLLHFRPIGRSTIEVRILGRLLPSKRNASSWLKMLTSDVTIFVHWTPYDDILKDCNKYLLNSSLLTRLNSCRGFWGHIYTPFQGRWRKCFFEHTKTLPLSHSLEISLACFVFSSLHILGGRISFLFWSQHLIVCRGLEPCWEMLRKRHLNISRSAFSRSVFSRSAFTRHPFSRVI